MLITNLVFFLVACVLLVQSNNYLVKSLAKLSSVLRINEFSLGFILVAVATSLSELFVGIMSALRGTPQLSVGNVIGANILDMTFIIGIAAILAKSISIESKIIKKDMIYMMLITMLPVVLMVDHYFWNSIGLFPGMVEGLSRIDGVILIAVFLAYMFTLIKQESKFSKIVEQTPKTQTIKYLGYTLVSLALLLLTASYAVDYAKLISIDLNLSPLLIGIFLISIGTTMPELVFTSKSVLSSHQSMAVGDIVGSVITNSTLVLGVTALIHPISVNTLVYFTSTLFMLFSALIFFTLAESDNKITWTEGITLLTLYIFFTIIETYITTIRV
jgi:cation:H+ antiporter